MADKKSKCAKVFAFKAASDLTRKIYTKFSFELLGSTHRSISLLDSGADISLISAAHLKQLCPGRWPEIKSLLRPTNITVSSFTSNRIRIEGVLTVNARFIEEGPMRRLTLYVIKENVFVPCPILIGVRTMGYFGIDQRFYHLDGKDVPGLTITHNDYKYPLDHYYLNDIEFAKVLSSVVDLQPGEMKRVVFYLNELSPLQEDVPVLVTSKDHTSKGKQGNLIVCNFRGFSFYHFLI